jgi:hypothetical protein
MKIQYEICDLCERKLPQAKWQSHVVSFVTETRLFFSVTLHKDKETMKLCNACFDSYLQTWKQFTKEKKKEEGKYSVIPPVVTGIGIGMIIASSFFPVPNPMSNIVTSLLGFFALTCGVMVLIVQEI